MLIGYLQCRYLTTIGGPWYFGRVLVPQRLINQSLYHEILLLISLQPQKKMRPIFGKQNWHCGINKTLRFYYKVTGF